MRIFKNPFLYFSALLAVMVVVMLFGFAEARLFEEPSRPYPGGSPPIPLDSSSVEQSKNGRLYLSHLRLIDNGRICLLNKVGDNATRCIGSWDQILLVGQDVAVPTFPYFANYTSMTVRGEVMQVPLYKASPPLVNNEHSEKQCVDAGGEVVDDGSGSKFCRFSKNSCPSGWTWYQKWSETKANTCVGQSDINPAPDCVADCTTGSHLWSNTNPNDEICTYINYVNDPQVLCMNNTCFPDVTKIGCY